MVAEQLSAATGVPADQLRLVLCAVACLPLGVVFRQLHGATVRYVVGGLIGAFFGWYCFGIPGVAHPLALSLASYFIIAAMPHRAPRLVFILAFGYMSVAHIYRMVTDYMGWKMDYTTAQMIVVLKVVQVACNVKDGQTNTVLLHPDELNDKLNKLPTIVEYLSYIFFYPSFVLGPNLTLISYRNFIRRASTPSSVVPTFKKMLQAGLCYVMVFLSGIYPVTFATEEAFSELSVFRRIIYVWLSVVAYRFRYYFMWSLSEAGCIACGAGWNGTVQPTESKKLSPWAKVSRAFSGDVDSNGNRWDLMKAVNILGVELAENPKSVTDNWNMTVGRFLRVYVYQRMSRPGAKAGNTQVYLTQLLSAIWHGFYAGYYLFFVSVSGMVAANRVARKLVRPIFTETYPNLKPLYDVVGILCTVVPINLIGSSFILLDWYSGYRVWKATYFAAFVIVYGGWALLLAAAPLWKSLQRGGSQSPRKKS